MNKDAELPDPRVRRTRAMLQHALEELMRVRAFERLSVGDIAAAASVNRATFYDHYPDKIALLNALVAERFNALMTRRGVAFDGSCEGAIGATVRAVYDYLEASALDTAPLMQGNQAQTPLEFAVIGIVQQRLLAGMAENAPAECGKAEMIASAASWSIYGAAKEWLARPRRPPVDEIVQSISALVGPVLAQATWRHDLH